MYVYCITCSLLFTVVYSHKDWIGSWLSPDDSLTWLLALLYDRDPEVCLNVLVTCYYVYLCYRYMYVTMATVYSVHCALNDRHVPLSCPLYPIFTLMGYWDYVWMLD